MTKITKSLLLCTALTSASFAWATAAVTFTSSGTVNQGGTAVGTATNIGACSSLNNADYVTIALSANNGGGYACNSVNVGVAVASSKGRGIIYSTNSNGGNAVNQTTNSGGRFTGTASAALTAAAAASGTAATDEVDNKAGT